ncbi:hypothetical protein, partial [Mesorhizobium sp. M1A.T.Ca.IN.004.03.1.1]|uniref:hypothetical protein n=1 Tax=Mesorhizobium sp. M1A.T.Ca.IN.004.03.1.1 TaxID=2496795 RepID=UPI0013E39581
PGNKLRSDAASVVFQTPLMVGCVRACWEIIKESPRVGQQEKARCELKTGRLLEQMHAAFENNVMEEGPRLRAEIGDYSVR